MPYPLVPPNSCQPAVPVHGARRPVRRACCAWRTLALACLIAACSETTGPTDAELEGRWVLRSVGGQPLPAIIEVTETATYALSAELTLQADGACAHTLVYRALVPGTGTNAPDRVGTAACRWERQGDRVLLTVNSASGSTAAVRPARWRRRGSLVMDGATGEVLGWTREP